MLLLHLQHLKSLKCSAIRHQLIHWVDMRWKVLMLSIFFNRRCFNIFWPKVCCRFFFGKKTWYFNTDLQAQIIWQAFRLQSSFCHRLSWRVIAQWRRWPSDVTMTSASRMPFICSPTLRAPTWERARHERWVRDPRACRLDCAGGASAGSQRCRVSDVGNGHPTPCIAAPRSVRRG